jgi:hypothetical protein
MTGLVEEDLRQFTGSTEFYRHSFNRVVIYTEGVQYLAERGKAYWLIDAIASHIGSHEFNRAAAKDNRIWLLHSWKLAVNDDHSAELTARSDSGESNFVTRNIPYTDFPLREVDVWAGHNGSGFTLMLPTEY